ncbi:sensor histidine kinase [Ammoniphilus sp. CFH 90114]|uniref:ATP-binding protein n=1 Tax=Ammoniphilus sp. CFH 90114 TaxID=2493665 RepID=UPI00100DB6C9|nr:sensor histidine kinase [Ammoniphilus sp. CFH 90114]RXT06962.1 sensor histidine kinase [Ammoniphilus sp. CFH 90114]
MTIFSMKMNLLSKMIFLISFVVLLCMSIAVMIFSNMVEDIIDEKLGKQALMVAKLAAHEPRIIEAFSHDDPSRTIQPIAEEIREMTGAGYVVIGNRNNIRYSHHLVEQIGREMGTSNEEVFEQHRSIVFEGTGLSGPAIKAKTPIYDTQGQLIGVSSVGFLHEQIESQVMEYIYKLMYLAALPLLLGGVGAYFVAKSVKRMIFGLEPEEISYIFKEKEAVLESIHDAILAVDTQGRIVSMNKKAREHLELNQVEVTHIEHLPFPYLRTALLESLGHKQDQKNLKVLVQDQLFIMDSSPIFYKSRLTGTVFSFRPVSEIEQLTEEFAQIKSFSDNMRAQNHEYLNKLNLIYGLLKINQTDKAIQLISEEVIERQDLLAFLMESVKDPLIAACLIGKANRSKELKVQFEIDQESELLNIPAHFDSSTFVTILGNIIDNALEAASGKQGSDARVKVSFTDIGKDIIFDIDDNGRGVSPDEEQKIFQYGYSTKTHGHNHGLGLSLVQNAVRLLNGQLHIGDSNLGGARFTVIIPKKVA